MKTVYVVRHGQSEANVGNYLFGDYGSPLTKHGRSQAERIAERCEKLPVDVIIASSMKRALETANEIAARMGKPVESTDLFRERRLPSSLEKNLEHPRTQKDFFAWTETLFTEDSRYEDGENFADVRERAGKALQYLEERPEENILVVAHGFFLRMLLGCVLFGENLTAKEFASLTLRTKMENTGVTVLNFGEHTYDQLNFKGWLLRVWNDHAHLG